MSSIALSSPVHVASRGISKGRFAAIGLGTMAAATLANTAVYGAAKAVVTVDPRFDILTTVQPTISVTLMAGLIAVLLYAGLLRFASDPARTFTIVSAVVFVVTLLPDLLYIPTVPGASVAQISVLILQHIVAAIVIVRMLTTLANPLQRLH
jgi:hypothetical protein